jgi:hypothetical protein
METQKEIMKDALPKKREGKVPYLIESTGWGHTSLIRHPNARERKKYIYTETKSCTAKG